MKPFARGLILAVLHVAILSALAGKLLYDRATQPRVWVKTAPFDPNLPIRGRYVQLQLVVKAPKVAFPPADRSVSQPVTLGVVNNELMAEPDPRPEGLSGLRVLRRARIGPADVIVLWPPVAFFISERVQDPSFRPQGEELWVEVTVPRKGPPRPIRLGVKKGEAPVVPLELN